MEFQRAICPSCGGSLQLPPDLRTASCLYCGGEVVVQDAIKAATQKAIPNLLALARAAKEAGNLGEAYRYYTQALEYDANHAESWFGKALAAGTMSTVGNSRIPEMIVGMQSALRASAERDRDTMREQVSTAVVAVADRFYQVCRYQRDAASNKAHAWPVYVKDCSEILRALGFAFSLSSGSKIIVQRILAILEDTLAGCQMNPTGRSSFKAPVPPQYRMELQQQLNFYRERMRELTPSRPLAPLQSTRPLMSAESTKALGILAAVVIGGFALIVLVVAIAGSVSRPQPRAEQSKNVQQSAPTPGTSEQAKTPTPSERLSLARAILADAAAPEHQIRGAAASLRTIPESAGEYRQASTLIKQAESKLVAFQEKRAIDENPVVLVASRWEMGGFGVVGVWKLTVNNRSDKPVGNLRYKTTYFSETKNEVGSNSGVIQKVIPPRQKRTIEVNDGFISKEAHTANFIITGWEFVR